MPVRLKDIADDLNLSKMTISKVLRGQADISPETKARVLQRAKELKYIPNITAHSLRTGQTKTLGLILPSLQEGRLAEIAGSIAEAIGMQKYGLIVGETRDDPELEQQQVENFLSRQVDALLLVPAQEAAALLQQVHGPARMRLVFIDSRPAGVAAGFVGIQEEEVGYLACKHLIDSGCHRIAYLRGPRTAIGDLRAKGFRQATSDRALAQKPNLIIDAMGTGESEYRCGFQAMLRLLDERRLPDAVVAYTDMMAIGAMDAALQRNLQIPGQIRFIGSGNHTALCNMRVPLSSIDLCGYEVGQRAARMAMRSIHSRADSSTRRVLVEPKLVKRKSSSH